MHEALRLRPVVPSVMRKLTAPMTLGRWRLAAGTVVAPCIYLLHRRADIYPEPASFRPERFLDSAPGTYTFLPPPGGKLPVPHDLAPRGTAGGCVPGDLGLRALAIVVAGRRVGADP